MKFSNFLFPQAETPEKDEQVIDECLAEAKLCDELGMEVLWLAEHHFDGNCAYVDPVSFAAALAVTTKQIKIGFAVAQMSLHHPVRMAEQMAMIDNISKGRLIVGLGRGTAHNIYDYRGYGLDPAEAQERLLESEEIMIKSWTTENLEHHGKYWDLWLPILRPACYTKPHPFMIRACSGEASMLDMARHGKPFLMNVQTDEVTKHRMDLYRQTMRESGFNDAHVAAAVDDTWVWRNIFLADTDAEAERIGVPLFEEQREHRAKMRNRILAERVNVARQCRYRRYRDCSRCAGHSEKPVRHANADGRQALPRRRTHSVWQIRRCRRGYRPQVHQGPPTDRTPGDHSQRSALRQRRREHRPPVVHSP